ncbi:HAUS augmin-like complex subunit 1 isoform X2 [Ostrea edulis]|uniref:HAUS augmin-like complex subunit 1 isoform X2 n=1 Tax=Ostrea edulis TaxID=37623 RepID=UPI0024AEA792|nr:HAUS augmin-like complex subunit 1 isoform X2 [Ostrea edulis]
MTAKHEEVQTWLEKVFAGDDIPEFELNSMSLSLLHNLMKCNEHADKDAQFLVDDYRQKAEEYNIEARRCEGILKKMNLSIASLSQAGVISLRVIANLALILQVKDTSDTSFLLAMQHLDNELYKVEEAKRKEERNMQILTDKIKTAMLKQSHLKKAMDVLEQKAACQQPESEKRTKDIHFIHSKAKEYKDKIKQMQTTLLKLKVDPSIYHSSLVKSSKELEKLQLELSPLQTKLQTYSSLPPDLSCIKVKIEELKVKLADLENEFGKRINLMYM